MLRKGLLPRGVARWPADVPSPALPTITEDFPTPLPVQEGTPSHMDWGVRPTNAQFNSPLNLI